MSDPTVYLRAVQPSTIAGRRRSERAKMMRHEKKWGLMASIMEPPPPEPPIEERIARFNANVVDNIRKRRNSAADEWRRARSRLRELPYDRAIALVAEWNGKSPHGQAWGIDLLEFLDEKAPTPERVAERRNARLAEARIRRRSAEKNESFWIEHATCPEPGDSVVDVQRIPFRRLVCLACHAQWSKADLASVEKHGILRIIDCRRAVQEELNLSGEPTPP